MNQPQGLQHSTSHRSLFATVFSLLGAMLLLTPSPLAAAPDLAARYLQSRGTELVIEITVSSPPPASAILIQHLPPDVRITQSSPGVNNYSPGKPVAKWLFRNLKPGKMTIHITLDRTVASSDISAELRFKPARGGGMATIRVEK